MNRPGHYNDVIMGAMASQITSLTTVCSTVYSGADQIKENIKALRHWPCTGNSPVIGEFPAQMASNTKNVSIWWRHHGLICDFLDTCILTYAERQTSHVSRYTEANQPIYIGNTVTRALSWCQLCGHLIRVVKCITYVAQCETTNLQTHTTHLFYLFFNR